jgi:hypothetical protein
MEPGGSIRVVSYQADKDGFRAIVHTSGKVHSTGAAYNYNEQMQHDKALVLKPELEKAQPPNKYSHEFENRHQLQHEQRQIANSARVGVGSY